MKMISLASLFKKYKELIARIKLLGLVSDPTKTALALTLGICIGIIPLVGVTFIAITLVGIIFRLNQIVLQAVHILTSPFQFLFLPVFIKSGQWLFAPFELQKVNQLHFSANMNFFQLIERFGHLVLYGLFTWIILCSVIGYIIYRLCLFALVRNSERRKRLNNLPVN